MGTPVLDRRRRGRRAAARSSCSPCCCAAAPSRVVQLAAARGRDRRAARAGSTRSPSSSSGTVDGRPREGRGGGVRDHRRGRARGRSPTVPDRVVLSATVGEPLVKAVAFGHGVRRALSAESRNRIWFEMRREVRARPQAAPPRDEGGLAPDAPRRGPPSAPPSRHRERGMNRGFWFVAGAGAGVYAMVKARRAAETFTPEGLRDRLVRARRGRAPVRRGGPRRHDREGNRVARAPRLDAGWTA